MEWNKVVTVIAIFSIILLVLPSLFKNGQFDVSQVSNLGEKVPQIWKIVLVTLGSIGIYTLIYKYKEKSRWDKQDYFILVVISIAIYFIWSNILSPSQIDVLTQATAQMMSVAGTLP